MRFFVGKNGSDAILNAGGIVKDALQAYDKTYPIEKPGNLIYHICFTKGTLVYGKNKFEPIENIKIGDSVYSYNFEKNEIELNRIINVLNRETKILYQIITENEKINVTTEHPFYVINKGWVKAMNLESGQVLKSANLKSDIIILGIKEESKTVTVYNIEVDGNHNYFVTKSNVLVHNKNIGQIKKE